MNRFFAIAAFAASVITPAAYAAGSFTALTAPDTVSRAVLAHALNRLDDGATLGQPANLQVHKNMPQIVEQNFARLDAVSARAVIDNLSDKELDDLLHFYVQANVDFDRSPMLMKILKTRLDAQRMARVTARLGFAGAGAPTMQALTSPMGTNPVWYNYTPTEIYLDLRTAPVGSLGVAGALFMTGNVVGGEVTLAWANGQAMGTAVGQLIQTYDPSLYDAIGGTVAGMVDNMYAAAGYAAKGNIQKALGSLFQLQSNQYNPQPASGGDYGASVDWMDVSNGGGGSCPYPCRNMED